MRDPREDDMLLLVRHGDAGDKLRWDGPDLLRPLSEAGRREAAGLVERLQDYPIEQILSSPAVRCLETVEPLASDRFLRIDTVAELGVEVDPAAVPKLVWDRGLGDTLLCSHGEMITWLLAQLAGNGLVTDAPLEAAKGSTWLLERSRGRFHAHYLPPLALDSRYTPFVSPTV